MVETKIVLLKLKKEYRWYSNKLYSRSHHPKKPKFCMPPEYSGWLLKETEKSYCLLLTGLKKDKNGNIDIPTRRLQMISREKKHCRRSISKERYEVVEEIDGPSIEELLTIKSDYIRTLALKFVEGKV